MNNITVKGPIQSNYPTLHQAEKKAADYTLSRAHGVMNYSVTELSEKSHASEVTVVCTCKRLDYQDYYYLKIALAKEVINPNNSYPGNTDFSDVTSLATFLLKKQAEDLIQSTQFFNIEVPESILKLLASRDTIFFFAAGNSNPLIVYGAYELSQLGLRTVIYVSSEMQINTVYSMGRRDLVTGISNSDSTNLMVDVFKVVRERDTKSVCITNYIKSPLSRPSTHQLNTAVNDRIFFEALDSICIPTMGVTDILVLLSMCKSKAHYEKYYTNEEFLGSRFKG